MKAFSLRLLTSLVLLATLAIVWQLYQRMGMMILTSVITLGLLGEYQRLAFVSIASMAYRVCFLIICFLSYLFFVFTFRELEIFILAGCILFFVSFWFLSRQSKVIHIVYGAGLSLVALFYIVLPASLFIKSFLYFEEGPRFVFLSLLIVFSGDVFAYLAGSMWGRERWMPHISPSKTWVGLYAGLIASGLAAGFGLKITDLFHFTGAFLLGASCFFIAQTGDLFISILKRREGLKNTSQLLPGHGGLLDRLDGLLLAFPVLYMCAKFSILF